jgi:hypothetical protein
MVLFVAIALSPLHGPAVAAHPWAPVRNTAPQQASGFVQENRPIHYPRLAHVGGAANGAAAEDRLLRELLDLHTAMSYQEAAEVADRLVQMMPRRPQVHYNRACVMGRLRRGDEALASLEQAVNCGWRDLVHLSVDPDLDSVRDTARYAALTQRLRQLMAGETAAPAARREHDDEVRRETPAILQDLGVPAATIAVVDADRVAWMTSITTDGAGPQTPGPDEPIEVSSVVRLLALVAVLKQEPRDAATYADRGRGPVLRQTSHGLGGRPAENEAGLIEAAEIARAHASPSRRARRARSSTRRRAISAGSWPPSARRRPAGSHRSWTRPPSIACSPWANGSAWTRRSIGGRRPQGWS